MMVEKKRKKQILSLAAFEKSFLFGFGNRMELGKAKHTFIKISQMTP